MPVDPYALCPCGSGKKLKFCCGDLAGEIEKIHRMIEGDQPRAALRHIEQTLAKHPGRATFLDLKAILELSLEEIVAAKATVSEFVKLHPNNPSAQACQALLLADSDDAPRAVRSLQRALELIDHDMPQRVLEAIGIVGRGLLTSGHVVAAQAHLWLHSAIAPEDDTRSRELLVSLNHYSGLPLILRDQLRFRPWPENVPWADDAKQVSHLVASGRWQQATAVVDRLGTQYGADPTLVYNRALLGGWLADERALAAGLHAFAQMEVPLDDAIEAEAVAQLIDPDRREEQLDSLAQSYDVNDLDALVARLASDRRMKSFQVDPASLPSDQPRPRHTYILLDKPMPVTSAAMLPSDVPRLVGVMALFGRQTDRRERLELTIDQGPFYDATIAALQQVAGDSLGEKVGERVVGQISATVQTLNVRWHFPTDTPPEARLRLLAALRHAAIVECWPEVRRPALDRKTPREAASQPDLRIPLMAAVLLLEQGGSDSRDAEAIAELRRSLGLPQPDMIDCSNSDSAAIPVVRVMRLKIESLTDDGVVSLYRRAILAGANTATALLARESVRRPSLREHIPTAEAYQRMIAGEPDLERALALIDEARQASLAADESTAGWDLTELQLHIVSGNAPQFQEVLGRIEREHLDDPQVAQELYRLLYEAGMIPPERLTAGAPLDDEAAMVGSGPAAEPSSIWTPDSERPAGAGKKSSLWTPS
jgi:tetratricopeptide (TPR) repeat protein